MLQACHQSYDQIYKLLLIGDAGVGKSSLLLRYSDNIFPTTPTCTLGVDFKTCYVKQEEEKIKVLVWDTAGQERFNTITSAYYHSTDGVLLVFDITQRDSFHNVLQWLQELEFHAPPDVRKILVGNKSDESASRQIPVEEAQSLAQRLGVAYFETSAKDASLVTEAFSGLIHNIYQAHKPVPPQPEPIPLEQHISQRHTPKRNSLRNKKSRCLL